MLKYNGENYTARSFAHYILRLISVGDYDNKHEIGGGDEKKA
jgi:hypothetical protein